VLASFASPEVYFKQSTRFSIIEFTSSLRFNEHTKNASLVEHLLPFKMEHSSSIKDISEAISFDDLPNSSIADEEYERWKGKWVSVKHQKH